MIIIVFNNAIYIKIKEIVVPLLYDVISKYDIIARAVIKFSQQQGDNSPKTLKENAATHGKHAVSRTVYFWLAYMF